MTAPRTEYGLKRSECDCPECVANCKGMPGYLLPSDLARLMPAEVRGDEFARLAWCAEHLRATDGARLLDSNGKVHRVPTLVPAHRADLSCHWLGPGDRCGVHADAPFGCAMFSCADKSPGPEAVAALVGLLNAWQDPAGAGRDYVAAWNYLNGRGLVAPPLADRKAAIARAYAGPDTVVHVLARGNP